jgi:adenosylcobinamide-GDP ribazoletransferase
MNQLAQAIQFLTILPVKPDVMPRNEYARIMRWFPLAGLLIGLLSACMYLSMRLILPVPAALIFSVLFQIIVTGALHIDGLADTCDGCLSGRNRERKLEIMRDSCLGTHGTIAIIGVILLKITLLTHLPSTMHLTILTLTPVIGRYALVFGAWRSVYARTEGLGHLFIGRITTRDMLTSLALTVLISLVYMPAIGILPIVVITVITLKRLIEHMLGGITGDTLGAFNEIAEVIFMTAVLSLHNWS